MRIVTGICAALFVSTCAARAFVTRCGNQLCDAGAPVRYSGANIYWLGLDENVPPGTVAYPTQYRIVDALTTARNFMGATIVRSHTLGISTGNPLSFEPTLGVFNHSALDAADFAIYTAGQLGLRLVIPLTDPYRYFHGGSWNFAAWLNVSADQFYWNPAVISAFYDYVRARLLHVNPYNGLAAKDDPTILAWETGNELPSPANWTNATAQFIKSIDPNHLVLDGHYGIDPASLPSEAVDMYSDHFYPMDVGRMLSGSALTAAAGKVYIAGEYGWNLGDLTSWLSAVTPDRNVSANMYWSLFPHLDSYGFVQHGDGFTVHYPGDNAAMQAAVEAIRSSAYNVSGVAPPSPPTPTAPNITVANVSRNTVAWQGGAGCGNYSVEVSPVGPQGPWQVRCSQCATDNSDPIELSPPLSSPAWLRARCFNVDGVASAYSPVVSV